MDKIDEMDKAYKAGFSAGEKHSNPSPDTIKLITRMEEKFDKLKDEIKGEINQLKINIAKLPENLSCKFASKNVEKVVYGLIILIVIAVASQWINNVVNNKQLSEAEIIEIVSETMKK